MNGGQVAWTKACWSSRRRNDNLACRLPCLFRKTPGDRLRLRLGSVAENDIICCSLFVVQKYINDLLLRIRGREGKEPEKIKTRG